MRLDIRFPIGLMFVTLGLLLAGFGAFSDPALYGRSLGINVNLWWGVALIAFGGICLWLARGKASKNAAAVALALLALAGRAEAGTAWSVEKANDWYRAQPWIVGADYLPSTAVNQLEMWQADTFDPKTIDRELGWANGIGFNTVRVFLHSLAWKQDPEGFKSRADRFLSIAKAHGIRTIFVFFDDCWNKVPQAGKQPKPKVGTHNSGWVQDPGDPMYKDPSLYRFKQDPRVLMWDLYNEPGNSGKKEASLPLLTKAIEWARTVGADQPITVGIWSWDFEALNSFQALNSDVITYHDYEDAPWHARVINLLKTHGRPVICTEYMARAMNSRFANTLPLLKRRNVGAINWGLVAGKSNTIYAWDTPIADGSEPDEWFHDIFRRDGTPYRRDEVDLIRKLTGRGAKP
ncbi:MAG: cellulase family glycosylhydrolase [Elusimicrobia bacterium]|nr:cellulase family glycosylhydrolase [Elusimicrobiota bacterium]